MKCEKVLAVLEDYRCGALEAQDADAVKTHVAACAACGRELELRSAEDRAYREYQQEVEQGLEVTPRMWHAVREAVASDAARRPRSALWRQAIWAAALIAVSVGATLLAMRYYESGNLKETAGFRSKPERVTTLEGALRSIERAEQEYTDAIRVLSEIVDKRKSAMDPRLVAELEASLKAIDENITATRKAYHEHPTDAELAHYMLAAYGRKVELLQHLAS